MIRSHSKQTPWIDFQEWTQVKRQLLPYSTTETHRIRRGLARVSTWSCRGRVPLSVQSTAQLLRIKVSDDAQHPTQDPDVLRLSYSMAIVRLVNGIVEPAQRTKTHASSVADTAERLGLPRWFVDVRHDATHTTLPSLYTLRMAANTALLWLTSHYWDKQTEHLSNEPKHIERMVHDFEHHVKRHQQQQHKRKRTDTQSQSTTTITGTTSTSTSSRSTTTSSSSKRLKPSTNDSGPGTSSTHDTNDTSVATATATAAATVIANNSATMRQLAQQIAHLVSPSIIRNVIINILVHPSHGRLLVQKRFNPTTMGVLKSLWMPMLDAMQQAWPFFYGALLATVVENIGHLCSNKLSLSARKSDLEKSLRWWANDVFSRVLHQNTPHHKKQGKSSTSSCSTNASTQATILTISIKKHVLSTSHRVAPIDRNRLIACVGVANAIDVYGALLSSMLNVTSMEDAASTTRNLNNDDAHISSSRAVQLLQLDSEIRALTKQGESLVTTTVVAGTTPSPPPMAQAPQLMSLDELESSIGLGNGSSSAEEESSDVELEEEVEKKEREKEKETKKKKKKKKTGLEKQPEESNEWTLCTSWSSCPIGAPSLGST